MIVHVKRYGSEVEFEDGDTFTHDEEIAQMARALPSLERVVASRPRYGLAPILELDDDDGDFEDFDASAFVERTYQ